MASLFPGEKSSDPRVTLSVSAASWADSLSQEEPPRLLHRGQESKKNVKCGTASVFGTFPNSTCQTAPPLWNALKVTFERLYILSFQLSCMAGAMATCSDTSVSVVRIDQGKNHDVARRVYDRISKTLDVSVCGGVYKACVYV